MHPLLTPFKKTLGEKSLQQIETIWIDAGITDDAWEQLLKHMQLVAASVYALAGLFHHSDYAVLVQAGLLHDVCKRCEVETLAPASWTTAQLHTFANQQTAFLTSHNVSPDILQVISQHGSELIFELVIHSEKVPLSQQLFLYADNIGASKGFVAIRERVERIRHLYPLLDDLSAYGFPNASKFGFYDLQLHTLRVLELRLAEQCGFFSSDLLHTVSKRAMIFLNEPKD